MEPGEKVLPSWTQENRGVNWSEPDWVLNSLRWLSEVVGTGATAAAAAAQGKGKAKEAVHWGRARGGLFLLSFPPFSPLFLFNTLFWEKSTLFWAECSAESRPSGRLVKSAAIVRMKSTSTTLLVSLRPDMITEWLNIPAIMTSSAHTFVCPWCQPLNN